MSIWDDLSAPFVIDDVKYRVQALSGDQALLLPYVDSRAVQNRLDSVLRPENWDDHYEEYQAPQVAIPAETAKLAGIHVRYEKGKGKIVEPDAEASANLVLNYYQKATKCILRVRIDGESWITKEGIADNTDIEGVKGGESQALRRAAVKYGIGRYLYELNNVWVQVQFQQPEGTGWEWTRYSGKDLYYRKPDLSRYGAPAAENKTVVGAPVKPITQSAPVSGVPVNTASLADAALSQASAYISASTTTPAALTPAQMNDFQARLSAVIQNNPDSLKYYGEINTAPDSMHKVSKMLGCLYYLCAQQVPGGEQENMIRKASASANFGDKLVTFQTVLSDVENRIFK